MLKWIEVVYICIEYIERICVPQCTHELSLTLNNCILMESVRKPWC